MRVDQMGVYLVGVTHVCVFESVCECVCVCVYSPASAGNETDQFCDPERPYSCPGHLPLPHGFNKLSILHLTC